MTPIHMANQHIELYMVDGMYSALPKGRELQYLPSSEEWFPSGEEAINALWKPSMLDDAYTASARVTWKREYDAGKVPIQRIWHD